MWEHGMRSLGHLLRGPWGRVCSWAAVWVPGGDPHPCSGGGWS